MHEDISISPDQEEAQREQARRLGLEGDDVETFITTIAREGSIFIRQDESGKGKIIRIRQPRHRKLSIEDEQFFDEIETDL